MDVHPARHMVTAGRQRAARPGQPAGGDYDLLACLADAAAAAPLGAPAAAQGSISQKPALDRSASGQIGPSIEAQTLTRRNASSGRLSPPPSAMDADVSGIVGHQVEREVQVTCNGTHGTFLLPSQTVQCHCARCSAASGGEDQQPQQPPTTITPTEFERHSGLLTAKKWRNSIRLLQGDGTITIGKWLEQHNILPRPKCSGGGPLLGSPGAASLYGSGAAAPEAAGSFHHNHLNGLPSAGNDISHGHGYYSMGHHHHHQQQQSSGLPGQRNTLPPSRYPASEYVMGEEEEYEAEEAAAAHQAACMGPGEHDLDGDVAAADDDGMGGEEGEFEDGDGGAEGRGEPSGRMSRRAVAQRGVRVAGGRPDNRRGMGRLPAALDRAAGGGVGRSLLARARSRQGPLNSGGVGSTVRRSAGGMEARRRGQEDGAGGGGGSGRRGGVQEHSSSEGSPPSDDSKRRDGSGGSGEGDGSGTGDGGDSRRAVMVHGGGGAERRNDGSADLQGFRRSSRQAASAAAVRQGGREGSAEPMDRSMRHAAAAKRLPPEYSTGEDIGPVVKRARTRGGGADAAVNGGGARGGGGGGGLSAEELAAIYDTTPQIRGWRFLGPSAGPASDQVLISVSINGRTFTGLLAPQQSVPPQPPPPNMGRPPLPAALAYGNNNDSNGSMAASGRKMVRAPLPATAAAATAASGRGLPPLGPSRRGVHAAGPAATGTPSGPMGGTSNDQEVGGSGSALPLAADSGDAPAAPPAPLEDEPPFDDGLPPDCPRCALCRRCEVPLLALPPLPPPPPPPPSSSLSAQTAVVAPVAVLAKPTTTAPTAAAADAVLQEPVSMTATGTTAALGPDALMDTEAAAAAVDLSKPTVAAAAAAAVEGPTSTATTATTTTMTTAPTHPMTAAVKQEPGAAAEGEAGATPLGPLEAASQPPPPPSSPSPPPLAAAAAVEVAEQPMQHPSDLQEGAHAEAVAVICSASAAAEVVAQVAGEEGRSAGGCGMEVDVEQEDEDGRGAVLPREVLVAGTGEEAKHEEGVAASAAAVVVLDAPKTSQDLEQGGSLPAAPAASTAPAAAAAAAVSEVHLVKLEVLRSEEEGEASEPGAGAEGPGAGIADAAAAAAVPIAPLVVTTAAAAAAAEASRTARQMGCGLGPLVEVRGGAGGGGAGSSEGGAPTLVHSQCALWSPDVFVIGGSMYGVTAVVKRGRVCRCAHCGRSGATLTCCSAKCSRVYHLPCALEAGAMLVAEPYSMACPEHRNAAALHPAASQPHCRPPVSRLRTAPSLDALTQSTAGTTVSGGGGGGGSSYQQMPQVALPMSLQMAAGRRVVQPPPRSAPGVELHPPTAAVARPAAGDASGLPALMMLRSPPDALAAAAVTAPSMPPPRAGRGGAVHVARGEVDEAGVADGGVAEVAAAAAWGEGFEQHQAAVAAAGGGVVMRTAAALAGLYGNSGGASAAAAAGTSSGQVEMSVGSEGTGVLTGSQLGGAVKRRREATAEEAATVAAAAADEQQQQQQQEALAAVNGMPAGYLAASEMDVEVEAANGGLSHASALALWQQQLQQQQSAMGPDAMHAMMFASGQALGGGEGSVGSPFAAGVGGGQGGRGGGGRSRPANNGYLANGQPNRGGGGGAGGSGGDEEVPSLHGGMSPEGAMTHVLPRAARNIEGLLPSRPLLHNPYVPSSGDPSADLALSKIATSGCRQVEAELLGGTTGRAGHTGRCAVCVIQRKGKCGTESAPKKCLRRQLVALQRATTAAGGAGSGGEDAEEPHHHLNIQQQHHQQQQLLQQHQQQLYEHGIVDPSQQQQQQQQQLQQSYFDERAIAAAAEMRARERARRETWSLPLGQGSGATGRRPPQSYVPQGL
ncbi:hypothetical protein Agub_g15146 [Astrephomene gubernaculifera]|uniref:PHD-type domain-containing protein n=1 Tax=Astrephomene gubernaculifera TaxID=47775 RepID=A0AAD3E342_9CHLO|nr:hypothetical protein Agub_g15146 [Astrephomene gubernaculifera]